MRFTWLPPTIDDSRMNCMYILLRVLVDTFRSRSRSAHDIGVEFTYDFIAAKLIYEVDSTINVRVRCSR